MISNRHIGNGSKLKTDFMSKMKRIEIRNIDFFIHKIEERSGTKLVFST